MDNYDDFPEYDDVTYEDYDASYEDYEPSPYDGTYSEE